jgi:hypothetical protein
MFCDPKKDLFIVQFSSTNPDVQSGSIVVVDITSIINTLGYVNCYAFPESAAAAGSCPSTAGKGTSPLPAAAEAGSDVFDSD